MKKTFLSILGIAAIGLSTSSQAALVVYEGFNYADGTNFGTTTTASTGTGFQGNVVDSRGAAANTTVTSPGLTYGSLSVAANKLNLDYNGYGTNESVTATLSATNQTNLSANSATYWASFIFQTPGTFETNKGFQILADRGASYKFWGAQGLGTSATTAELSFRGSGTGAFSSGLAVSASSTYMAVMQITRTGSTQEWITNGWLLSAGSIPADTVALGAAQVTIGAGTTSGSANLIQSLLFTAVNAANPIANPWNVDEFRIGNDYVDVSPIPEPSTWALLAGSLTTLMTFRRRRQS